MGKNIFKNNQDGNHSTSTKIQYTPTALNIDIPDPLMEPPATWKPLEENDVTTVNDLMINYVENTARFRQNALLVEILQNIIIV